MVEIDIPIFVTQIITFILAVPLMWLLFFSKLIDHMKKRDEFIKDGVDRVEKGKAEIESMKTDYEQKLVQMQQEAKAAFDKAVADGEAAKQRMIDEAKEEGRKIAASAKAEIEGEKQRAIEAVKDAIVDISILAARKAIQKNVNKKDQARIVEKYVKEVEKNIN